jgi:hypothetical protein
MEVCLENLANPEIHVETRNHMAKDQLGRKP